jgi:hypothetical protein
MADNQNLIIKDPIMNGSIISREIDCGLEPIL